MHAALAMAATHDRYLGTTQPRRRTLREQYHSTQCITLFNQKLSEPVRLQDRDPLWATAAMLAILAVSSVEAESIEDSWPLASVSPLTYSSCMHPTELDWINISEGKRTIWNLVDPLRPDSIFYGMRNEYTHLFFAPLPVAGVEGIPVMLAQLCGLNALSTMENNHYFAGAHAVTRVMRLPYNRRSVATAMDFLFHMHKSFRALSVAKDPIALLLMALWYSEAGRAIWWLEMRSRVEGPAICLYLQRYHRGNAAIQGLLPWRTDEVYH